MRRNRKTKATAISRSNMEWDVRLLTLAALGAVTLLTWMMYVGL